MARLKIASSARADLRDIRLYSKAAFGAATARSYLGALRGRFDIISNRPLVGRVESDLGPDIRSIGLGSHRIYYEVSDEAVLVVRILHHAQDVGQAFGTRS